MTRPTKRPTITEALRAAIDRCPQTRYAICKGSGVTEAMMSQFMRGKSLRLESADRLAAHLGLILVPDPNAEPLEPTPAERARPQLAVKRPRRKKHS